MKRTIGLLLCLMLLIPPALAQEAAAGPALWATHFPAYLAALQVAEGVEGVSLSQLLQPQAGYLEDYAFTELDFLRAQEADILIFQGGGLEDFLGVFAVEGGQPVIVAAQEVDRIAGRVREPDEDTEAEENPYIWLSPTRFAMTVAGIAAALCEMDPDRAEAYTANNAQAMGRIQAVRQDMEALAAGAEVVVMHPALAYFALDAGCEIVLTVDRDPGEIPNEYDLADLEELLLAYPEALVLLEDTAPQELWDIAPGRTVMLDALTIGHAGMDKYAWDEAMEENMARLGAAIEQGAAK